MKDKIPEIVYHYWNTACTPKNVRIHCFVVGYVARYLLEMLEKEGYEVNPNLAYVGGLLHDTYRVINFPSMHGIQYTEKDGHCVPIWKEQIAKYSHIDHEEFIATILEKDGHDDLAGIVRMHQNERVLELVTMEQHFEEKCLYYADKRVAHAHIVTFDERVAEANKRHHWTAAEIAAYKPVWEQVKVLEKQMFSMLPFDPQALNTLNESIEIPENLYG